MLDELKDDADGVRIGEIHARLEEIDAHSAPARAARILAGLGFDETQQRRSLDTFSGGWRMRVALAAGLFSGPDLLLLDEPTNHLDLEASVWLEGYLARYPHGMLLVSHDRDLLNRVADGILHLDAGKLGYYPGNYDRFERTRRERQARQIALHERQRQERDRIQAFVDRFRYKATKARQAQSRLKMLERMEPIATVADSRTPNFNLPTPEPLAPPILVMEDAAVGYEPETPVLRDLDLRLDMDDRIALLGRNGNGKTTLLRLMIGALEASGGRVRKTPKLKIGYFAQDQFDLLEPGQTGFQDMARRMPKATDSEVRAHLGRFGLEQDKANTRIEDLSGGEKARLVLAATTVDEPQLLLLDEPTNHLDIDAREALVQALNTFEGAIVLVSHDPHLVALVADRLWFVGGGTCRPFEGDLDDYRRRIIDREDANERPSDGNGKSRGGRRAQRRDRAAIRNAQAPLRKAVQAAERQMDTLSKERAELELRLADSSLYSANTPELTKLTKRKSELDRALLEAENAWLNAQAALETAT